MKTAAATIFFKCFLKKDVKVKTKTLNFPWITKRTFKSCKCKQNLYIKYLK